MNLIKLQERNLQKTIALTSPELQSLQMHLFLWAELKHCKFLFRVVIKLQASAGNHPEQVQLLLSEIVAEKIGKLKK